MGSLFDLGKWCFTAFPCLLLWRRWHADRSGQVEFVQSGGDRNRFGLAGRRLVDLRPPLQVASSSSQRSADGDLFHRITAVAYGLVQVMGSRAAYIHVGAMIGTCMAANVFFVIIPGQRASGRCHAGKQPDASEVDGALRSLHNSRYAPRSVHHGELSLSHDLRSPSELGASCGDFPRRRMHAPLVQPSGQGHRNRWLLPVAAVLMVGLAFVSKPKTYAFPAGGNLDFYQEVYPILQKRCVTCHAAQPTFPGYLAPPGGRIRKRQNRSSHRRPRLCRMQSIRHTCPPAT